MGVRKAAEKTPLIRRTTNELLRYHEIPAWQQENEYILSGYRPTSGSIRKSLSSLFHLHNETVSIYSHLTGFVLFIYLPIRFRDNHASLVPTADAWDIAVFTIFLLAIALCFITSTLCHTFWNHSPKYASMGNRIDCLSIVVLLWGSTIPVIYYGLYQETGLRNFYWTIATVFAALCMVLTLAPRFHLPHYRPHRALLYTLFALSSLLSMIHGLLIHGWATQSQQLCFRWLAVMVGLNAIGGLAYVTRIPERYFPYVFDIIGGSHQILHIMVILAGVAHWKAMLGGFEYCHLTYR